MLRTPGAISRRNGTPCWRARIEWIRIRSPSASESAMLSGRGCGVWVGEARETEHVVERGAERAGRGIEQVDEPRDVFMRAAFMRPAAPRTLCNGARISWTSPQEEGHGALGLRALCTRLVMLR